MVNQTARTTMRIYPAQTPKNNVRRRYSAMTMIELVVALVMVSMFVIIAVAESLRRLEKKQL